MIEAKRKDKFSQYKSKWNSFEVTNIEKDTRMENSSLLLNSFKNEKSNLHSKS